MVSMQGVQLHRTEILFFWLSLLFTVILCHNKDEKLEVAGFIEHPNFTGSKVKVSQTFSGLHVTIGCRSADGKIKTMGSSEISKEFYFRVFLPQETVKAGVIREECYAQVHSASDSSCPLPNSQETLNIIFRYKGKEKNTIIHSEKFNFSPITCSSKFLWPFHKPKWLHTLPPQFVYPPPRPPMVTPEAPHTPSFSPSDQPEDVPPAVSPAYNNPLPNTPVPPAFSAPKSKQPSLPKHKDLSPAPAPCFDTPESPVADDPLPLSPSHTGNVGFSPAPTPSFDTLASPPPHEALPSGLSPSPLSNTKPLPPHVPGYKIPQPPPIPTLNRPSPPAS